MSTKKPKVTLSKLLDSGLRHRILNELQKATRVNEEGKVSWSGHADVDQYVSVLKDAFTFPAELSRREAAAAVRRGIFDARGKGKLTDASVLEELQRIADSKLAEPFRQYSMWSRLSYRPPIPSQDKLFTYQDVSIRLSKQLPRYMQLPEDDFERLRPIATKDKLGFGFLIAVTQARNGTHASDKIFRATEVFQAVYNLALKPWNILGSEQKPEAILLMGPYHFLFKERKSLLNNSMWYNQSFRDEHWNATFSESAKVFKSAGVVRQALSKLDSHPLKEPLTAALLMMNDGMEAADMSRRTLRYWTALERLFQAGDERATYDKIIRRATYLDDPSDLARAKLNRLVRIRNRYVHMGATENEHHQLTQYLADHVKSHLFYVLFNGDDFADHGEFIEMTDLPSNSMALQRRRRAIDRRERMIEKRRHRSD